MNQTMTQTTARSKRRERQPLSYQRKSARLQESLALASPQRKSKRDLGMRNETESRTEPVSSSESGRQRVQLDFTPEALERLREIKELAGVKTNAEVVRNAIRLYEWFLKQRAENYKFQLVKDDKVKEVEVIF